MLSPRSQYLHKSGGVFEFRYVSSTDYGFLFGMLNGRDAYIHVSDLEPITILADGALMDLANLSMEQLQALHRERRVRITALRAEMDQIEAVLEPMLARASAIEKLKRAGLSKTEIAALAPKKG